MQFEKVVNTNLQLETEDLEEFKQIIFEEYGVELTPDQAYSDAIALLSLVKTLTRKDPVEFYEEVVVK